MKGLIYANTGDLVYGSSQLAGLLNSDYDSAGNLLTSPGAYRYSGNDITKEKYLALENYVQSGNPVVLADSFYLTTSIKIDKKTTVTTTTINDTAIDDASWMYRFAYKMYTEEHKSNVLKYGDLSANTTLFASYLNMPKVMIDLEPLKNLDVNGISHVAPSSNGKYYLTFDFTIQNMSAISQKYYDCSLYMDTDSDGRFADSWDMNGDVLQSSEKISGIKITCAGTTVQPREVIDSSGTKVLKYFLGTGIRYHLEAAVPSGCQGVMPWKIEVAQTDNDAARESTTGYSLLETARKEDIRILQIRTEASDSTLGTSAMNLQDELAKSTDQSNFSKYIKELDEFDVSVTTVSGAEYAAYYQSNTGYLNDFDMLILGFADCYSAIDNSSGAVTGIYDFIASGKGVLFTHDTTPLSADSYLSYQKKTALRNITGMDRYGVTVNDLLKTGEKYLFYTGTTEGANYTAVTGTTSHEVAYEPNSNCLATSPQVQGYTYSVLNQKMLSTYDSKTQLANLAGIGTAAADYQTTYISQVNQGLVTTYPYNIDENLQVSATHAPYYQLNLAADDDGDGEGDVVVWYCLGGSPAGTIPASGTAYSKSPNDVRNNYFIYSKGNVVYSGIHLTGSTGVEETKLFINTMIAAYSAGVKDPSVTVLENANAGSIEAENIYVPYDAAFMNTITDTADQMGKLLDDYKSIYFKIEDPNFVKGTKIMSVKYYRKALETETSSKLVGGEPVIELTDLKTYIAGTITEVGVSALSSGTVYEASVNVNSYLAGKNSAKIYVEIQSELRNTENVVIATLQGHDSVNLVMTQLFDLE